MIILTPFGTTTGLEVVPLPLSSDIPPIKFEDAWIEVTGGQIALRSGKDAYVVLRKHLGQQIATWIGLYRSAREIGYDRPGGFYGAGAWLIGCTANTRALLDMLRDMADQVQSKAMSGDRFIKRIDQVRAELVAPPQVNAVISSVAKVGAGCLPSGSNAFVVATDNHLEIIDWAQNAPSSSPYCRVIVGNAEHAPSTVGQTALSVYPSLASAIDGAYLRVVSDFNQARSLAETHSQQMTRNISNLEELNANLNREIQVVNAKFVEAKINADQLRSELANFRKRSEPAQKISKSQVGTSTSHGNFQPIPSLYLQDRSNLEPTGASPYYSKGDNFGVVQRPSGQQPENQGGQRSSTNEKSSPESFWGSIHMLEIIALILFSTIIFVFLFGFVFRDSEKNCLLFNFVSCKLGSEKQIQSTPDTVYQLDKTPIAESNSISRQINSVPQNVGNGESGGNLTGAKRH